VRRNSMHYSALAMQRPASPTLARLGFRVRTLRRSRGWSRAELAERSGLSVRFLARIEAGEGNISLVRLERLASALGTSPSELVRPDRSEPAIVALVGMRGAGKSTVGPLLAERLAVPFYEMDRRIAEAAGLPLDQIFELHGERYYRQLEFETLRRVLEEGHPAVIAAAGGVVNEPASWGLLLDRCSVVWLRARPEEHWARVVAQGDSRPMKDNPHAMAELRSMLAARERLYRRAHLTVDTSGRTPTEVVEAILAGLGPRGIPS